MFPEVAITDPEVVILLLIVALYQLNNQLCLKFVASYLFDVV